MVEELTMVNTAVSQGYDNNPYWPGVSLQAGQQEGNRVESYQVTFDAGGKTYSYTPEGATDFSQFEPGSEWLLTVNNFGNIVEMQRK